jgi:hypothetical protein
MHDSEGAPLKSLRIVLPLLSISFFYDENQERAEIIGMIK